MKRIFAKYDTEAEFGKASARSGKYLYLDSSGVRRHPWSDMRNPLVSGHANQWHGIWEEFPPLSTGPLPRQTKDEIYMFHSLQDEIDKVVTRV